MEIDGNIFQININPPQDLDKNLHPIKNLFVEVPILKERRPETEEPEIYCPLCQQNPTKQSCIACNKKKYVTLQSNFSKFVVSILRYKMGKDQEEIPKKKFEGYAFQASSRKYQSNVVTPNYLNQTQTVVRLSQIIYRKSLRSQTAAPSVHRNVKCNNCDTLPIVGSKYSCRECQSYDLCQKCFDDIDHEHNLFAVHESKYSQRKNKLRLHADTHKKLQEVGGGVMNLLNNLRNLW